MKFKPLVTVILLVFVVVSLGAAVADVAGWRTRESVDSDNAVVPASGERWVAYYFHSSTRCPTCRRIETHAQDAVAEEVKVAKVDWRVVNYEEPANQHFAKDFKLLCPSVVLAQVRDGATVRWKNLERVWELNDDRAAFLDYVRSELAAFKEVQP